MKRSNRNILKEMFVLTPVEKFWVNERYRLLSRYTEPYRQENFHVNRSTFWLKIDATNSNTSAFICRIPRILFLLVSIVTIFIGYAIIHAPFGAIPHDVMIHNLVCCSN